MKSYWQVWLLYLLKWAREISLKNSGSGKKGEKRENCWNNFASHCIYYILWIGDKQKLDTTYASFEIGAQTLPRGKPRILNIRSRVPGVFIRAAANARHRKQNPVCPKGGTRLREIFCRGWLKIGVGEVDACFSPPSSTRGDHPCSSLPLLFVIYIQPFDMDGCQD